MQPKSATTRITELLDENCIPQSSQVAMENICYTFYSCLYAQRMDTEENRLDSSKILRDCLTRFSPTMQDSLMASITLAKLTKAVNELAAYKSPGLNGMAAKFYKVL